MIAKKRKTVTLLSGTKEGWYWEIPNTVTEDGKLINKKPRFIFIDGKKQRNGSHRYIKRRT